MGAYERMRQALSPLGLYRLDGTSMVETKLRLIGSYMDILETHIGKLPNNYFVENMDTNGLKAYRTLYCLPSSLSKAGESSRPSCTRTPGTT